MPHNEVTKKEIARKDATGQKKTLIFLGSSLFKLLFSYSALTILQFDLFLGAYEGGFKGILNNINPNIISVFLFAGCAFLAFKQTGTKMHWYDYVWSMGFSLVVLIANVLSLDLVPSLLFSYESLAILSVILWLGITLLCLFLLHWAKCFMNKALHSKAKNLLPFSTIQLSGLQYFLCVFGVIFISWSPFLIANYPGAIEWDAYHQIEQFLGVQELTNHWPVVSTFFMGAIVGGGIPLMQASSYAYLSKRQFVQCLLRIRFLYLRK